MDKEKYRELLVRVVQPIGDELCSASSQVNWISDWENRLYFAYETHRNSAHQRMKHTVVGIGGRIDRHKVGAALMLAVLQCRPLTAVSLTGTDEHECFEYIPNEVLAFKTGLQMVVEFSRTKADKNHDVVRLNEISRSFQYPPADDGDYREHAYKALYYAQSLDIFILANLLFVLEAYDDLAKRSQRDAT